MGKTVKTETEFVKFSKKNSLFDMKKSGVDDLMIQLDDTPTSSTSNSQSDIDKELEHLYQQRKQSPIKKKQISKALEKRLNANPNELRRKNQFKLPDKTRHRVIVFDTETA